MRADQLSAYLRRIGLSAVPAATLDGLIDLQRAHRQVIAFENLDIPLRRPIDVASEAVFAKLVERKRGGYCFEQNRLFCDALRALGFAVRPLLGRVHLGQPDHVVPPRTHMLLLVTFDLPGGTEKWIADAGFGGAYTPPQRLGDHEIVTGPDGAHHRLVRQAEAGTLPGEWRLDRAPADQPDAWSAQYSFEVAEVADVDLAQANHWTSTRAGERFTTLRIVSIALPQGFASLTERTCKVTAPGDVSEREIADAAEYRAILADRFGLRLSEDEVAALGLFPA